MRTPIRSVATLVMAVGVATCSDAPLSAIKPGSTPLSRSGVGRIALAPVFSKTATAAAQRMGEFGIAFDSVRVLIRGTPDTLTVIKDTTVFFDPHSPALTLDLMIAVQSDGQRFDASIDYRNDAGVVFHGHAIVQSHPADQPAPPEQPITIDYVGPGAQVSRLVLSPKTITLSGSQSATLIAAAFDSAGHPMGLPPLNWSSSDGNIISITTDGVAQARNRRGTVTLTAMTPTSISDDASATVVLPPASIALVSGGGQSGKVGSALSAPAVVQVNAADGAGVAGVNVVFSAPTGGAVGASSVTTDGNGRASTTLRLGTTAGPEAFAATAAGFSVAIPALATAGDPAAIVVVSGSDQSDTVRKTLAPLIVRVTDSFLNPVAGVAVSWAVTAGAARIAQTSTTTDADGQSSAGITLGTTAGPVSVTASAAGVATPATFSLTALPAAPASIEVVSGDHQTGSVGHALGEPFVVRVLDATGAPVGGARLRWASAGGSLASSTTTDANGESSNTMTLGSSVGDATARAEIANGASAIFTASAVAGPAAAMVFTTQPAAATAGATMAPVRVSFVDALGNPSPATANVTLTLSGPAGGTLHGTRTRAAVNGVATFDDLSIDAGGNGYLLVATSGALPVIRSLSFNISDAAPSALAINGGDNQTGVVGTAVTAPPSVRILSGTGTPLGGIPVTFTPATGSGSVSPVGGVVQTDALGVATLAAWTLGGIAGAQTLVASAAGLQSVTFSATARAAAASRLVLAPATPTSFSFVAGTTPTDLPMLHVEDAFGNPVAGVPVQLATSANVSGQLTQLSSVSLTSDANGSVAFTSAVPQGSGAYVLTATTSAIANASLAINVEITPAPGVATSISAASELPQTALVGTSLGIPLRVLVHDGLGAPVPGVDVTFSVTAGDGSLAMPQLTRIGARPLANTTRTTRATSRSLAPRSAARGDLSAESGATTLTVQTDADGFATVSRWTLGPSEGRNAVTASVGALSTSFSVTGVDVHAMTFVAAPPASMRTGVPLGSPVVVQVADAAGNPLAKPGVVVTVSELPLATTADPPHVIGTTQAVTDANGQATFADLRDSSRVQTVKLAFDAASGSTALPTLYSDPIGLTAGVAAQLLAVGSTTFSTAPDVRLTDYPSVAVTDIAGNAIASAPVTFSASPPCLIGETPVTDASGKVTLNGSLLNVPLVNGTLCSITARAYVPQSDMMLRGSPLTFNVAVLAPGTSVWTGGSSAAWADPANWMGGVPTPASVVSIAANGRIPTLPADLTIAGLTMGTGAMLQLDGHTLSVAGDVNAAAGVVSGGTVALTGSTGSLTGALPNVVLGTSTCGGATYSLSGSLGATGDLTVNCPLSFGVNAATVSGNLLVQNAGALQMTNENSSVVVMHNATFDGPANDQLTAGVLEIRGDFTQLATVSPASFTPSATFNVLLTGTGPIQTVSFASSRSRFTNLEITSTGTVALASNVAVSGNLTIASPTTITQPAGDALRVSGNTVAAPNSSLAGVSTFISTGSEFPNFLGSSPAFVSVQASTQLSSDVTVTGALELTNALSVGAHHLTVGDSLRMWTANGELVMSDANGLVSVHGNVDFAGMSQSSLLDQGTLEIGGNFRQRLINGGEEFMPGSAFVTKFNGTTAQTVNFESPGNTTNKSFFANVVVTNPAGVTQVSNVYVTNSLTLASGNANSPARWTTGANTLTTDTLRVSQSGVLDKTNGGLEARDCRVYELAQILGGGTMCVPDPALVGSALRLGLHPAWMAGLRH